MSLLRPRCVASLSALPTPCSTLADSSLPTWPQNGKVGVKSDLALPMRGQKGSVILRALVALAALVTVGGFAAADLLADDHNFDIGPAGANGVPSTWDNEAINVLDGNVHLSIPLYSVQSGDSFGISLSLNYDSKVWDASAISDGDPSTSDRNLIARSVFGLGWKMNFGRVFSLTYTTSTTSETYYYFQGMDGATHRLLRPSQTCL